MKIKNATKQGYIEAEIGDGIDISSRMESHRGTVQKGLSQTLTCQGGNNVGVVVLGLYNHSKSEQFMQGRDRFKETKVSDCLLASGNQAGVVYAERERENRIYVLGVYTLANVLNLWALQTKITKVWLKLV